MGFVMLVKYHWIVIIHWLHGELVSFLFFCWE